MPPSMASRPQYSMLPVSVHRCSATAPSVMRATIAASPPAAVTRSGVIVGGSAHAAPQVGDRRARVQLLEHVIAARVGCQPRHATIRVVEVAEYDGVGRARL